MPAFRLELTASDGLLPTDTRVRVQYGGEQMATYSLKTLSTSNEDLCCRPSARIKSPLPEVSCGGGEADAGDPEALLCELWTDGSCEVTVTASGYPALDQVLSAQVDDQHCGVLTVDALLRLGHEDGGT
jgi:hypothetical protein